MYSFKSSDPFLPAEEQTDWIQLNFETYLWFEEEEATREIRIDPSISNNAKINCLMDKLLGTSCVAGNPEFKALLNAFFGKGFDVTFKVGTLQNNNANAETGADPNDPTKYNIVLNTNKINSETQMGWAKTLLHEAFYANLMQKSYELFGHTNIALWLKKSEEMTLEELMDQMELKVQGNTALGILHHNFMAENINDIKIGLTSFSLANNPNHSDYTDYHFGALAYHGLKETTYYLNKLIKNPDGSLKTVEINGHQYILQNVNDNFYDSIKNESIPCN